MDRMKTAKSPLDMILLIGETKSTHYRPGVAKLDELYASIQVHGSNTADCLRQRSQRESVKCRMRLTCHIVVTPVIDHYAKCT